ncbi:hypothetical protein L596_011727 [Steinernema carpocapsae]|uniref:Uncharacterized protein n=1 Tax=Steinernema carpocapsae TaxID=34508 RepID=A0A4U5NVL7_STECR|nr:hypothetical protein L596_011727 [Steinernema carpocapsae]
MFDCVKRSCRILQAMWTEAKLGEEINVMGFFGRREGERKTINGDQIGLAKLESRLFCEAVWMRLGFSERKGSLRL